MFSPLRNRFGIPGVISVIALVFAMLGGAYAASSNDNGKATASAKAKKGPKGPKGATGPAGPAGPAGSAGPAGAKGDNGAAGSNGTNGTNGAPGAAGQSVTTAAEAPFGECGDQEGVKLTSVSGANYVCNGAPGADGQTGFTETLPVGKTEKGTWTLSASLASSLAIEIIGPPPLYFTFVPVSFGIPVAGGLDGSHVHFVTTPEGSCTGSVVNPTAASGHLCVYASEAPQHAGLMGIFKDGITTEGASSAGAFLAFAISADNASAFGSWAVTG